MSARPLMHPMCGPLAYMWPTHIYSNQDISLFCDRQKVDESPRSLPLAEIKAADLVPVTLDRRLCILGRYVGVVFTEFFLPAAPIQSINPQGSPIQWFSYRTVKNGRCFQRDRKPRNTRCLIVTASRATTAGSWEAPRLHSFSGLCGSPDQYLFCSACDIVGSSASIRRYWLLRSGNQKTGYGDHE
ncbi:MAG: hypothetical protein OJF50_002506 [Nitrospira sp.]|jgi:hypothetical protein|nr:hypothetical protein [Nitrospira sp.]